MSGKTEALGDVRNCPICRALLNAALHARTCNTSDALEKGEPTCSSNAREWSQILGSRQEIFDTSSCDAHSPLIAFAIRNGGWMDKEQPFDLSLRCYNGRIHAVLRYIGENSRSWVTWPAELLTIEDIPDSFPAPGMGRRLEPNSIDSAMLREWKLKCETCHGEACLKKLAGPRHSFMWLADTTRMCLVPATNQLSYVALSYVWGQADMLKTRRENLGALRTEGALDRLTGMIPATIRDALRLVPLLGERYLWVDSLCIVQDDDLSLGYHLRHMASIFEHATVTVVAADGQDAARGLCGLSRPREEPSPVLTLTDTLSVVARNEDRLNLQAWSTRGWTMQEQMFSRKMIVFFDSTVRWICRSNIYYEDVHSPLDLPSEKIEINSDIIYGLAEVIQAPDMSGLMEIIESYNERNLTFNEDVMVAIMSTFAAMSPPFPRGFIYGLPVSFFDAALLWRSGNNDLTRRTASRHGAVCPPSWTWAGWQGYLCSYIWSTANYVKNASDSGPAHWEPFQAIPYLKWYLRESPDAAPQPIPYQNDWYEYKCLYMGETEGLPHGWKCEKEDDGAEQRRIEESVKTFEHVTGRCNDPDNPVLWRELQTPFYYTHPTCPQLKFWHPVPVGKQDDSANGQEPELFKSRFLCTRTDRARLQARKPRFDPTIERAVSYQKDDKFVVPLFSTNLGVSATFRDKHGEDVGELAADSQEDLQRIWEAEPEGFECDVVAVSRGFDFPDPQKKEVETWTFYNVLWVEFVDGIAYRKGVGRVKRRTWDDLDRQEFDLVLG